MTDPVPAPDRTTVILGGRVFTADPGRPFAEAVVVEGDSIVFVGDRAQSLAVAGPDADVIDADGGLIMPGFIDGHVHIALTGANRLKAQLRTATTLDEIQARIVAWADANPEAPRVLGTSWLHSALPGGVPTKEMLDAVIADRPVYLDANDLHSSWVNSAALAELGITNDTPDPLGGRIVRDPATGEATGELLETVNLELVWPLLARIDDDQLDANVAAALVAYAQSGITSVVEMALDARELRSLERLRDSGRLTARVVAHLIVHHRPDPADDLAQIERARELADEFSGDDLRVAGIKLISDGTIDSCTAAMIDPYTNGTNDVPIWDAESLQRVVVAADAAGLQIAIHAIGDLAVRNAIDAIEQAQRLNRTSGRRHRIEHLEYADEADIPRLGALGITASMQPVHLDPAILENWIAMLGPERAENGFAWPRYVETGATLALGTDTPTAPLEALPNMYLASTRRSPGNPDLEPLRPEWALELAEALAHGTRESAKAAWLDHLTGRIEAGMAADLIVLDTDPLATGPDTLLHTTVVRTIVDGRTVWQLGADAPPDVA